MTAIETKVSNRLEVVNSILVDTIRNVEIHTASVRHYAMNGTANDMINFLPAEVAELRAGVAALTAIQDEKKRLEWMLRAE